MLKKFNRIVSKYEDVQPNGDKVLRRRAINYSELVGLSSLQKETFLSLISMINIEDDKIFPSIKDIQNRLVWSGFKPLVSLRVIDELVKLGFLRYSNFECTRLEFTGKGIVSQGDNQVSVDSSCW